MGYITNGLLLNVLRDANRARLPQFKNARGELAHSEADGSDWKLSAWVNATFGEVGELGDAMMMLMMVRALGIVGNTVKKIERGDIAQAEAQVSVTKELADVQIYLDLLAERCGVNLSTATIEKFNEVSERVGSDVFIRMDGSDWYLNLTTRDP